MAPLRALLGLAVGFGLAFGSHLLVLGAVFEDAALPIAGVVGVIGGAYSALAFGRGVYVVRPLSIVGYVLDMTWSMLNTVAAFVVWIPACTIVGSFVTPDALSRRSGAFVFTKNPRGGGYAATTIGTTIGGGWSSHEEIHVWQGRLFGPLYMPSYMVSLLLNMLVRVVTGKVQSLTLEAYYRICFEDWAYAGGSESGGAVRWQSWALWLVLTAFYVGLIVLIVVGITGGGLLLALLGVAALIVYSVVRAFTPAPARRF